MRSHFSCEALSEAVSEWQAGSQGTGTARNEVGVPRMLLHRPRRGGLFCARNCKNGFDKFSRGSWVELARDSWAVAESAKAVAVRRNRRGHGDADHRAARAEKLAMVGELSAQRQALESAELAPGNLSTLRSLTNPARRPARPREAPPPDLLNRIPEQVFELDEERFAKNVRSARRGAAAGPSGMTSEHLFPMLENGGDLQALIEFAGIMARGDIPPQAMEVLRLGRMSALQKPVGGVRGIVVGDTFRRIVARTMAQQVAEAAEAATAPFQHALRTRAGTECVSHVMQTLTDLDPRTTRSWEKNCGTTPRYAFTMARTAVWNRGGEVPLDIGSLERAARLVDPSARVWRGGIHSIPEESGILILGTPSASTRSQSCRTPSIVAEDP